MNKVKDQILEAISNGEELLAVLIDPEKFNLLEIEPFLDHIPKRTRYLFIGGSTGAPMQAELCVKALREKTSLPLVLFPGDHTQITPYADGLLFLSLLSGRNPEYLIDQQIRSVDTLRDTKLEIIPTGYLLIDGGKESAVQRVTGTDPLPQDNVQAIVRTALAGEYSGKAMIYLEAGSGANYPVSTQVIRAVKNALTVPLIVGGGIRSQEQLLSAYAAGADLVVVGTAFEQQDFFI